MIDLTDWTCLFTFGYHLDIYVNGILRMGIDNRTEEVVIKYVK